MTSTTKLTWTPSPAALVGIPPFPGSVEVTPSPQRLSTLSANHSLFGTTDICTYGLYHAT